MGSETYDSIIGADPASFNYDGGRDCSGNAGNPFSYTYHAPSSSVRSYQPVTHSHWRQPYHNDNFHARKRAGEIVMAPYSVGKRTVRDFIVQDTYQVKNRWAAWHHNSSGCCDSFRWSGVTTWIEQNSFADLGSVPIIGSLSRGDEGDVDHLIRVTQTEATAQSFDGVDLLTEIAEFGKTYQLGTDLVVGAADSLKKVADRMPRGTSRVWKRMSAKKLLRSSDKLLRRAGRTWLGAIYGIAPVAYLIEDALDLNRNSGAKYFTYRSSRTVGRESKFPSSGVPHTYIRYDATGDITVRSTVKVRYSMGSLQSVADQLAFNAFRTAWELIPFSFVVDWFINAGDVITSQTSLDLSTQRASCTSIKRHVADSLSYINNATDVQDINYVPNTPCDVQHVERFVHQHGVDALLRSTTEKSYSRIVYAKPDAVLSFDPFLNWKRIISGIALSYGPAKKILSRLRS